MPESECDNPIRKIANTLRYPRTFVYWLGIAHGVLGILTIIDGTIALIIKTDSSVNLESHHLYAGIWCGSVFVIVSMLQLFSSLKVPKRYILIFLICCFGELVFAGLLISTSVRTMLVTSFVNVCMNGYSEVNGLPTAVQYYEKLNCDENTSKFNSQDLSNTFNNNEKRRTIAVIYGILIIFGILECLVISVSIIFCCRAMFCSGRLESEKITSLILKQLHTGQTGHSSTMTPLHQRDALGENLSRHGSVAVFSNLSSRRMNTLPSSENSFNYQGLNSNSSNQNLIQLNTFQHGENGVIYPPITNSFTNSMMGHLSIILSNENHTTNFLGSIENISNNHTNSQQNYPFPQVFPRVDS